MGETDRPPLVTAADCVLVHTAATVATTVHREGGDLVVHLMQAEGVTRWTWPCDTVESAVRTPGVVRGTDGSEVLVDPETADLLVTLACADGTADNPDGAERTVRLLAVPGAAVRRALAL